jgi:hypothetical protein
MMSSSTTGDFHGPTYRPYLETYNATRGSYRGAGKSVAANAPVRFFNAEKTETWLAQNSMKYLGFDLGPKGGPNLGPGQKPGYTIFVLNTWNSPEALSIIKPQHEYHTLFRRPDRPGHARVRGDRLESRLGRQLPRGLLGPRRRTQPVRVADVGQPPPRPARVGCVRSAALGVPEQRAAHRHRDRRLSRSVLPQPDAHVGQVVARVQPRTLRRRGELVPLPALVPVRAAAQRRPLLPVEQHLARQLRRAAVAVGSVQALQPGRRLPGAAHARSLLHLHGRHEVPVPEHARSRSGDAPAGEAGR